MKDLHDTLYWGVLGAKATWWVISPAILSRVLSWGVEEEIGGELNISGPRSLKGKSIPNRDLTEVFRS